MWQYIIYRTLSTRITGVAVRGAVNNASNSIYTEYGAGRLTVVVKCVLNEGYNLSRCLCADLPPFRAKKLKKNEPVSARFGIITRFNPLRLHLTMHSTNYGLFHFDVQVTVHRDKFLLIKPTRCTNFSNLFFFCNKTLHVSDSSSVHHQVFFTVQTVMVL